MMSRHRGLQGSTDECSGLPADVQSVVFWTLLMFSMCFESFFVSGCGNHCSKLSENYRKGVSWKFFSSSQPAGPIKAVMGMSESRRKDRKKRKRRARAYKIGTEGDHHNQSPMILEEHHLSSFLTLLLLLPPSFSHFMWYCYFDLA